MSYCALGKRSFIVGLFLACLVTGCRIQTPTEADTNQRKDTPGDSPPTSSLATTLVVVATPYAVPACEQIGSTSPTQIAYRGVLPGITTRDELANLLGQPQSISQGQNSTYWHYDPPGTSIITQGNHVIEVLLQSPESKISFDRAIADHGCPDLIYAFDVSAEKTGFYTHTWLIYLQTGIRFLFSRFPPVSSSESVTTREPSQ